jgi:predicted Fe-Mo cluster-binding NifX family protein
MRIAVPVLQNNEKLSQVSEHFGHAPFFAFIDVEQDGEWKVEITRNPAAAEHVPGQIPQYIISHDIDVVIARGIGGRAIDLFDQAGIQVIRGASGLLEEIITDFLQGTLEDREYNAHHDHHHSHHE